MRLFPLRKLTPVIVLGAGALALAFSASGQSGSAFPTNTPQAVPFATNTPPAGMTILEDSATDAPTRTPTYTATATFTPSPTATFTPTFTPTPIGPLSYPEGVSPLTGQLYPSDAARDRRNLIIKISNYPPVVRPQSGLNQADVVYEYEVEGGVTRFAAIFRNNAPRHVGPVRSGRLLDLELIPMYDALFTYSGASQPVQALLLGQTWSRQIISPSIGDNCVEAGICRFPATNLAFEHTLYADTEMVWQRATARGENTGYRARGFAFNETPDPNGIAATDIFIDWYGQTDARWQYDPATTHYLRYTDGLPHFDALDGQQVWADNMVVIEVPHEERPDLFEPESHSASQQIDLWGQGRAFVFRDGVYYQGFWRRDNTESGTALQLLYGSNVPIMLEPGRTWVTVVRWLGDDVISDTEVNMQATGTALSTAFTITPSPTPGVSQTPEATLSTPMAIPR